MNRYLISGADKTSGQDKRIELMAATEADAREAAVGEGILITECKMLQEQALPRTVADAHLHEIVLWLRFMGTVTALAVFAYILKIIMSH